MPRIKILKPDPDLEAEGLAAGAEAEMAAPRAAALAARGLVAVLAPAAEKARAPAENQALPFAPETKQRKTAPAVRP